MSHFCSDVAQFVACTLISRVFSLTIVPVYVRPTEHFVAQTTYALRQRFPAFLIICGDFNAHDPSWGTTRATSKEILAEAVDSTHSILMNDGQPTYFLHQGALSMPDLTFASPYMLNGPGTWMLTLQEVTTLLFCLVFSTEGSS